MRRKLWDELNWQFSINTTEFVLVCKHFQKFFLKPKASEKQIPVVVVGNVTVGNGKHHSLVK